MVIINPFFGYNDSTKPILWREAMQFLQILPRQSHLKTLLICVVMAVFLSACSDEADRDKDVFGFEGGGQDKILNIEVTNTQNESLKFKTNQTQSVFQTKDERPTLLFFISKDCTQCQDELLHILDLHNKYQEFISIVAISPKEDLQALQDQINAINPRFKLYAPNDDKNLLNFLSKDEKQSYIALYDKQGEKVIDYVGLVPEEMIELDIRYLIQDKLDAKAQDEIEILDNIPQEQDSNPTQTQEQK
ncbi:TlpA family protein disulfide reductase [Helicobacter cinaedi]|nr:thioredoxin-like domain-containing protein [Helicobacter cinaedi]